MAIVAIPAVISSFYYYDHHHHYYYYYYYYYYYHYHYHYYDDDPLPCRACGTAFGRASAARGSPRGPRRPARLGLG